MSRPALPSRSTQTFVATVATACADFRQCLISGESAGCDRRQPQLTRWLPRSRSVHRALCNAGVPTPLRKVADAYERIAPLYDLVPAYRDRGDIAFYLNAAKQASGDILEIGCGSGRVLIPIAREGHRITGLDVSAAMLDKCRDELAR